jgi:prepilin-type N-terminal cleavage/methylation domain-containing protein
MAKFKNEKGLTLIELLITIAVLAVVSAIALPVINNVVSSSNSNAAAQTQSDVNDFIAKYNAAGEVLFSSSVTTGAVLSGYVDTDGDNNIDANELVDTLTIDTAKFSVSAAGTSDNVGGSYTAKGVSGATITLASATTTAPPTGFTTTLVALPWGEGGDFNGQGSCNWASGNDLKFYCGLGTNAQTALAGLTAGQTVEISAYQYSTESLEVVGTYTVASVSLSGTPTITFTETVSFSGDFRQIRF